MLPGGLSSGTHDVRGSHHAGYQTSGPQLELPSARFENKKTPIRPDRVVVWRAGGGWRSPEDLWTEGTEIPMPFSGKAIHAAIAPARPRLTSYKPRFVVIQTRVSTTEFSLKLHGNMIISEHFSL